MHALLSCDCVGFTAFVKSADTCLHGLHSCMGTQHACRNQLALVGNLSSRQAYGFLAHAATILVAVLNSGRPGMRPFVVVKEPASWAVRVRSREEAQQVLEATQLHNEEELAPVRLQGTSGQTCGRLGRSAMTRAEQNPALCPP